MPNVVIEQCLYGSQGGGGYRFLARSSGFLEEWLPLAQSMCAIFGERPAGLPCPECLFAKPFGKSHVVVVQVADQGVDDAGLPCGLGFWLLVVSRADYVGWIGDPFLLADRFAPCWKASGELPELHWQEAPPYRLISEIQVVLQRDDGPFLLGAVQALVDGGRIAIERNSPDTPLLRSLWLLLPNSTRSTLWPASFAFNNALGFDAVVLAPGNAPHHEHYLSEGQAESYPEGSYELGLQIAVEAGDQRELDTLLARRSRAQTWLMGLMILSSVVAMVLCMQIMMPPQIPEASVARPGIPKLLPAEAYPALEPQEYAAFTQALAELVDEAGIGGADRTSAEILLSALADRLETEAERAVPTTALRQGPLVRRLRALLWKAGDPLYGDPALSPIELVARLRARWPHDINFGKGEDGR